MATTETVDVVMPQMGVSVSEGTITKWLKQEGEQVEADEPLLEISTDKVDTEVPSPGSGTLTQILVQEGATVDVGTKLAVIGGEGGGAAFVDGRRARACDCTGRRRVGSRLRCAGDPDRRDGRGGNARAGGGERDDGALVHERQDLRVAGRGEDRVRARRRPEPGAGNRPRRPRDEEGHPQLHRVGRQGCAAPPRHPRSLRHRARRPPAPSAPPPAAKEAPAPAVAPAPSQPGESFEPMTAMRKGIAEHMRRSLDTSAHVTSAIEVDMSRVSAIRAKLKKEYQQSYGVNPTYLIFVARAAAETLREYPWINGEIRGDQIVTRSYVNLGFAVELQDGKGLIVPVVKNAETLNLLGMAKAVTDIAQRARDKKLLPDEVQGGTFTITNPGGYGTFHGTPVISQPQAAILGTYAVVKRPWVVQDELGEDVIAIRPIMNLTLTYDHRLVDGALAGRFLRDLREKLETWDESAY